GNNSDECTSVHAQGGQLHSIVSANFGHGIASWIRCEIRGLQDGLFVESRSLPWLHDDSERAHNHPLLRGGAGSLPDWRAYSDDWNGKIIRHGTQRIRELAWQPWMSRSTG
ncbi:hypothetical protein PMAYCL1PPCAC_21777, partial [Pristionchus mayeri]